MGSCKSASVKPQSNTADSPDTSNISEARLLNNKRRVRPLPPINVQSSVNSRVNDHISTSQSSIPTQPIRRSSERQSIDDLNSSPDNFINILLLGESGVGKSTFINAIVNYFQFDTLEKARNGQPIALIPVLFTLTVGDQFDERHIRFGDLDLNEDHFHPGQSVTQQCRSYIFPISKRTKIRFIDTPGMGDTRGFDQDDLNLQHILSFITNLSHLNAVCILLKPNESRLNIVFRSYFTRLVGYLGENVRNNIIFCFTNTRATFFAPGNTGPLVKEMLKSNSVENISLRKANTFCFDSESFRYLIALQYEIEFDDYQTKEYRDSWIYSAKESNRLLTYICNTLKACPQSEWKSIEHAQFQIIELIRPVLETIRNILRNIILQKEKSSNRLIILVPKMISRPSMICYKCKQTPQRYSKFWIFVDDLHNFVEQCTDCNCNEQRHFSVNYRLDYTISNSENNEFIDDMNVILNQLKQTSLKFGYFFCYLSRTSMSDDPILYYLNQIIKEEKKICQQKDAQCLNSILLIELNQYKDEYEQNHNRSMSNKNSIDLMQIYNLIEDVNKIDLIKEQIDIIKQYHQTQMIEQEKEIL